MVNQTVLGTAPNKAAGNTAQKIGPLNLQQQNYLGGGYSTTVMAPNGEWASCLVMVYQRDGAPPPGLLQGLGRGEGRCIVAAPVGHCCGGGFGGGAPRAAMTGRVRGAVCTPPAKVSLFVSILLGVVVVSNFHQMLTKNEAAQRFLVDFPRSVWLLLQQKAYDGSSLGIGHRARSQIQATRHPNLCPGTVVWATEHATARGGAQARDTISTAVLQNATWQRAWEGGG